MLGTSDTQRIRHGIYLHRALSLVGEESVVIRNLCC